MFHRLEKATNGLGGPPRARGKKWCYLVATQPTESQTRGSRARTRFSATLRSTARRADHLVQTNCQQDQGSVWNSVRQRCDELSRATRPRVLCLVRFEKPRGSRGREHLATYIVVTTETSRVGQTNTWLKRLVWDELRRSLVNTSPRIHQVIGVWQVSFRSRFPIDQVKIFCFYFIHIYRNVYRNGSIRFQTPTPCSL